MNFYSWKSKAFNQKYAQQINSINTPNWKGLIAKSYQKYFSKSTKNYCKTFKKMEKKSLSIRCQKNMPKIGKGNLYTERKLMYFRCLMKCVLEYSL